MQKICTLTNIGGTMERERSGKIPWIVVLLLVTALCALSYLAAYLVHRAGGGSFGSYRAVGGSADMQLQVAGDGFVYYDGSTLTQVGYELVFTDENGDEQHIAAVVDMQRP